MVNKISKLIQDFSTIHPEEIRAHFQETPNTRIITQALPPLLKELLSLDDNYRIYGSVGTGNWSEIPWVGILDKSITESTKEGYYVVILFNKELKSIFLALGVGWVQFKDEYGATEGKKRIREVSDYYAKLLKSRPPGFKEGLIDLGAENGLGRGYEQAEIISKEYKIDELSDEELIADLRHLVNSYSELKTIVGDSILNLEVDAAIFDDTVNEFKKEVAAESFSENIPESIAKLIELANEKPPEVRMKLKKEIVRNKKFADFVKRKANFICEICGQPPFIQRNGKPYAEADHISPLGGKTRGLDSPNNMRCLCAQCHAILTHGSDEEVKKLLSV